MNETSTVKSMVTGLKPVAVIMPLKTLTSTPKALENWSRTTASICISATSAAIAYSFSFGSLDSESIYVSRNGVAGTKLNGLAVGTEPVADGAGIEVAIGASVPVGIVCLTVGVTVVPGGSDGAAVTPDVTVGVEVTVVMVGVEVVSGNGDGVGDTIGGGIGAVVSVGTTAGCVVVVLGGSDGAGDIIGGSRGGAISTGVWIGVAVIPFGEDGAIVMTGVITGVTVVFGGKDGIVIEPGLTVGAIVLPDGIDGAVVACEGTVGVTVVAGDDDDFPCPFPFLVDLDIFPFFDGAIFFTFGDLFGFLFMPFPLGDGTIGIVGATV